MISVVLALSAIGCGGDSDSSSTISYRPFSLPESAEDVGRTAHEFLELDQNGLAGREPKPVIPNRPPPEFLVLTELIDGAQTDYAEPGDRVTIQYVGAAYDSKEKFASSWDEGRPFAFTLGGGELIDGLEEGLEKIELADRREIIVPPELATGGNGRMKGIPPDATLVFVIEVLDIKRGEK